jgi:phosphatidylinositol dimannoside acyltransferase
MRANAAFVWSYYWRFAHLISFRAREKLYDRIAVIGNDRLTAAAASRRGVILLSVHLGDFDVAGGWLVARRQIEPVVVSAPLREGWRDALFSSVRRRAGVIVRDLRATDCDVLSRDLELGRAVLVMLDRRSRGSNVTSRMFGRPAVAPAGIANLAASTGATLLPAATWRADNGSPTVWFGEPFSVSNRAQAIARLGEVAQQLGRLIATHPEQWHVPVDLGQLSCALAAPAPTTDSAGSPAWVAEMADGRP